MTVDWQTVPRLDEELDLLLMAIADAALSLWPQWYSSVEERFELVDRAKWPRAEVECRLARAQGAVSGVSGAWFRRAWSACQEGRRPVLKGVPSAEQLRQLALALDPQGPLLVLTIAAEQSPRTRVLALARAAEWLAAQARTMTVLVVPESWQDYRELDCVNYGALHWDAWRAAQVAAGSEAAAARTASEALEPPAADEVLGTADEVFGTADEVFGTVDEVFGTADEVFGTVEPVLGDAPRVVVEPAIGMPHPGSKVERKLYEHLMSDAELRELFRFNVRVFGFGDQPYYVDLHWPEGRLVVEIDGDDHRGMLKFRDDRERDYRLLLAGFTVLRVTNSEVIERVMDVLEKIRSVVCHCHKIRRLN